MRSDLHPVHHLTRVLPGQPPAWRRLLFLPGLFYSGVVRGRNLLFDAGLLRGASLPNPVISIGNLTVGGTGKTPLAIHVARIVRRMGAEPALLSRGYHRVARGSFVLAPGELCSSIVKMAGDEPALIRRQVPGIWLGISSNRHAVGLLISRRTAQAVFLLDDGFQHRRLRRDLDIVVIDRSQPLEHNRIIPGGTLREPLNELRRADLIVINGSLQEPGNDPLCASIKKYNARAAIIHCTQHVERLISFDDWRENGSEGSRRFDVPPVFLVAAIGNPRRFCGDVSALGVAIAGARFYRDHYSPGSDAWEACVAEARACGAGALLTTEKDAIKLPQVSGFPLLVAVQSTRLAQQAELEAIVRMVIGSRQ